MPATLCSKKDYLRNPCRASSLPYYKTKNLILPEYMQILHEEAFPKKPLTDYEDSPYFRLYHNLQNLPVALLPDGFSLFDADLECFAAHINACYPGCRMTAEELCQDRAVFCAEYYVAVCSDKTRTPVATGIAALDREIGEATLEWIQVSEGFRKQGLGTYVVSELLARIRKSATFATVSGSCHNPSHPETLYRKCGFTGHDIWHILKKRTAP